MAAKLGKPSITTPRQLELRDVQSAIDNTKERFRLSEAEIFRIASLVEANSSFEAITLLQTQLALLQKTVAALNLSSDTAELAQLLTQGNGIVVLKDGHLITRVLTAGVGIVITWPDGAGGNPVIATGDAAAITLAGSNDEAWPWDADLPTEGLE